MALPSIAAKPRIQTDMNTEKYEMPIIHSNGDKADTLIDQ